MDSRLTVFGIVFFAVGILLLAFLLRRVFKRIRYEDPGDFKSKPPGGMNIFFVFFALACIVLAQGFFWMSSQLKYFRVLNEYGDIGRLTASQTNDPVKSLEIRYVPASYDSVNIENLFFLSGDSWRFSGEILRFKFAREYLRLPERCYKTVEFNARFLNRRAPSSTGTLFHSSELEGGGSKAFEIFRDNKYFGWFAEVDSFASDFVTTDGTGNYDLNIESDGDIKIRYSR
ncbi:MAG: hypothetical protein V3W18_06570 [candidate division Zixibacteria bacterium]